MSEIGHKLSIPRRQHYKTVPLPCQHLGTVGSVIQIYSEGLNDDMAYSSLPRDTGQPVSGVKGMAGDLPGHIFF